jgi:hypothetical protein
MGLCVYESGRGGMEETIGYNILMLKATAGINTDFTHGSRYTLAKRRRVKNVLEIVLLWRVKG